MWVAWAMHKLGVYAQGFYVAMEVLGWQPVCCNLQMKVQNKISQIIKQLLSGVCVVTASQWAPQQRMCAVVKPPVSPDMKNSTYYVSTT